MEFRPLDPRWVARGEVNKTHESERDASTAEMIRDCRVGLLLGCAYLVGLVKAGGWVSSNYYRATTIESLIEIVYQIIGMTRA